MNYPKMLYMGNLATYQTAIADDEDHESELVEQGWCEYGELPEAPSGPNPKNIVENSLIPTEQFDALASRVVELEGENTRLKEVIEKGSAENADLQKKLRIKELEDMSADELKKLLDDVGVTYQARDGKPVLVQLALNHESKVEA